MRKEGEKKQALLGYRWEDNGIDVFLAGGEGDGGRRNFLLELEPYKQQLINRQHYNVLDHMVHFYSKISLLRTPTQ